MFSFFRRKDTLVRWFLSGLLLLVCATMVTYLIPGMGSSSSGDDTSVLAKTCGEPITLGEVQQRFQQMSRGRNLPPSMLTIYAPQIVNQLATERAVVCEAKRLGLKVTETELVEALGKNSMLYPGGQFIGVDRYREVIENQLNMTVPQFEEKFREELLVEKLRRMVVDGVTVTDAELDREYRRDNDKVKLDYVFVKTDDQIGQVQVSEAELRDHYQKNKASYPTEEKRSLKYVFLDPNQVKENIEVSDTEIRRYYDQNRESFRKDERVQAAQILLKTTDKTAEQIKEAEKKAKELVAQARAGADFAELAKKNSEDVLFAGKGGDLGWVVHGQMLPDLEKVLFSLPAGKVSDPVKTALGFQIIKVSAKETAHLQTLDEVRLEILKKVRAEKGERVVQDLRDRLELGSRKFKDIAALGADLKLPVLEAKDHMRGENYAGVGAAGELDVAVFSTVIKPGEMSGPVSLPQGGSVVFRLDQITPSRQAEFAEVRARVEGEVRMFKADEIMRRKAGELASRARALNDLKKAATELKLTVKTSEPMTREGKLPDVNNMADFPMGAFNKKPGEIIGPLAGPKGQLVYAVAEQLFANPDEVARSRGAKRGDMLLDKQDDAFILFQDELRERLKKEGKITINEAAMRRFQANSQP